MSIRQSNEDFVLQICQKKYGKLSTGRTPVGIQWPLFLFPECVERVPVSLWRCGGRAVLRLRPQPSATVRNRSQPFATVRKCPREVRMAVPIGSSAKGVTFGAFQRRVASFCVAGVALCDISTCFMTCQNSFRLAGAILLPRFQKMYCIFRGRRSTLDTSDLTLRGKRSTLDVACCVVVANRIVSAAGSGDKVQIPWQAWYFRTGDENRQKLRTKRRFWGRFVRKLRGKRRFWRCDTLHLTLHTWHPTLYTPHFTLYILHVTLHTLHLTLHTLYFTLHTLYFTLHTLHSTLYTLHFTLDTLHSTLYTPHFTLYNLHFTPQTLHSTFYTLHSTLYTLHPTLYTPHFTLYTPHFTLHFTLYTLHSPFYTLHFTLHISHFTLYTPHFTLYTPHFTPHTLHSTLYTVHLTVYTPHFTLYTLHSLTLPFFYLITLIPGFVFIRVSIRVRGFHLVFYREHNLQKTRVILP